MADSKIPEKIKHFIYKYIDSVEILDILLYMRLHAQDWHTAAQIDRELKTQAKSIANRLATLKGFGLVEENANDVGSYKYSSKISETDETIALLAEEYKIRRYQIYELIFSQNKQIKNFADAFVVVNKKNKKGDENG